MRKAKRIGSAIISLIILTLIAKLATSAQNSPAMANPGQFPALSAPKTQSVTTCDAPWPTPPALACPWLPTPTPQPAQIPAPTWSPPTPPAQTPTPLPTLAPPGNPEGNLVYWNGALYEQKVNLEGIVARTSHRLKFQTQPYKHEKFFSRLAPAPRTNYVAMIGDGEAGEIVTIATMANESSDKQLQGQTTTPQEEYFVGFFYGWHPNGVEFLLRNDYGPDHGLWLVNAHSSAHRLIARQPTWDISGAAISPDGQRLMYATNTFDVHQIWMANADGSESRLLFSSPRVVYIWSWSPDGRYVLYTGDPSPTPDTGGVLWVMDRNGQNRRPLQTPFLFGFGFNPVWSPTGTQVAAVGIASELDECWNSNQAFRADPLCQYRGVGVYVEDVDSGQLQMTAENAIDPYWSPDGNWLTVSQMDAQEQVDIWALTADGAHTRRVTYTAAVDRYPTWLAMEDTKVK